MPPELLRIPSSIYHEMCLHLTMNLPEEACGLLGGIGSRVIHHCRVANMLHSPAAFRMDAHEQLQAMLELEARALDMLAIYHSHPDGPAYPSPADLQAHLYPDSAAVILTKNGPEWDLRAFWIRNGQTGGIPVMMIDGD